MSIRASIQIPTWRRKDLLRELLLSLESQTIPRDQYEILVCDSGSGDGTDAMVRELAAEYGNIRFLDVTVNTLSYKRNHMFQKTDAPIVILLDDDMRASPEFVAAHVNAHRDRQKVVFCGEVRFPRDWVDRSNYYRFRDSRHIGPNRPDIDPKRIRARNLVVMNFSCKRREFDDVGFMSEEFKKYGCEDHEFAWRVEQAGFSIELADGALAYHYEGTGRGDSLLGYERKCYSCARYGIPVLNKLAPDVLKGSRTLLLDPAESRGMRRPIWAAMLRSAFNPVARGAVRKLVLATDRARWAYAPALFKYLVAGALHSGCIDRSEQDFVPGQTGSWL